MGINIEKAITELKMVGKEKEGLLNKLSSLVPKPSSDVMLPVDRPFPQ